MYRASTEHVPKTWLCVHEAANTTPCYHLSSICSCRSILFNYSWQKGNHFSLCVCRRLHGSGHRATLALVGTELGSRIYGGLISVDTASPTCQSEKLASCHKDYIYRAYKPSKCIVMTAEAKTKAICSFHFLFDKRTVARS